jgi:predicted Zn finger-like uncharacterized protein
MIVTCPNCSSRFKVGATALGAEGRRVKCSRCAHVWRQRAEGAGGDAVAAAEAPSQDETAWLAPPSGERPAPADPAVSERRRRPLEPPAATPPGKRFGTSAVVLVLLVVLFGAGAGAFLARDHVVAAVPGVAKIYALLGAFGEVPGAGLELRNLDSERRRDDGVPVLVIRGEIVNAGAAPSTVPSLRGSLYGADGAELTSWRFAVADPSIAAGASAPFETEVRDPPVEATDLKIRFADQ